MLNALSQGVNVWAKLHIYRVNRLVANVHVETAHTWLHFSSYIFHIQDTHKVKDIYDEWNANKGELCKTCTCAAITNVCHVLGSKLGQVLHKFNLTLLFHNPMLDLDWNIHYGVLNL